LQAISTWYLEEILKATGYDLEKIKLELIRDDFPIWEEGIAP
jgi:hypothetical protein